MTIIDVARAAGVSTAAVSLVLNDAATKRVSAAKRDKILQVASELGYTPNGFARALSGRAKNIVGLFVPMRDPIFFSTFVAEMLAGIQSSLRERGYHLMIYSHSARSAKIQRSQIMQSRFVDGVIFANTRMCSEADIDATIDELTAAKLPFVMVNSYSGDRPIDSIGVDDLEIGRAAARYLAGKGHRKLALLLGAHRAPIAPLLRAGFEEGLREFGIALPAGRVGCGEYDADTIRVVVSPWLKRAARPTAIFCADDQMAPGLYDCIRSQGLKIPGDVAVLGRADLPFASYLTPKLTTIAIPIFEMGRCAAELLIQNRSGRIAPPQRMILKCALIERESA